MILWAYLVAATGGVFARLRVLRGFAQTIMFAGVAVALQCLQRIFPRVWEMCMECAGPILTGMANMPRRTDE